MTAFPITTEVAIVGAGTAGAAAALCCAQNGLEVVCVDRSALDQAGAHWVNGVPASCFERAGIAPPEPPECLARGVDFHLVAGYGPERVVIEDHDLMEVDMRRLVERLQTEAREAGATFIGSTRVRGSNGPALETDRGRISADWIVDASGLSGARLLDQKRPAPEKLCAAAQAVYRVSERAAAKDFFARHDVPVGDTLCFSGIEGGYSILNLRLDGEHLSILTGSIPADGHRSGRAILRDFVDEHDWIGEREFGGSRAIPVGAPLERFVRKNVVAIGDAARQVFSAHGSGIGAGLIAARLLADALADGRGPKGYERDWQAEFGPLFASYAVFADFTRTLTVDDLADMMRSGLMDADMATAGLTQRMPPVEPRRLVAKVRGLLQAPALAARLAPAAARMALTHARHRIAGR